MPRLSTMGLALSAAIAMAAPALAAEASLMTLQDDFEGQDFDPSGGLYYKDNFEQSAGTVEFSGEDVREGEGALSLSLKSLCGAVAKGCSERAEVWERPEVLARYDAPVWYGFSMKLAEPIPEDDHRYLVAQWKREMTSEAEKGYSPFLAVRLDKGRLTVTVETDEIPVEPLGTTERPTGCKPGETLVNNRPHDGQTRALIAWEGDMELADWRFFNGCTTAITVSRHGSLPSPKSGWIDLAFFIQTGPDGGGMIEVLANGQRVATAEGHIGHEGAGLGERQYFKFGPYRAGKEGDWTVLYDRFRRGPKCSDVTDSPVCSNFAVAAQ